jgi:hypothetical protein
MKNYIIIVFLAMSIYASAQEISSVRKELGEVSIHCGGGLLSMSPTSVFFNGHALDWGVGYTFFINPNWGFHFGVEPGLYRTKNARDINVLTPNLTDRNGHRFDLYTTSDYSETCEVQLVNIPIMLQAQTAPKQLWKWKSAQPKQESLYAKLGVKAHIPVSGWYSSRNTSLTNMAYYTEMDNWAGTQNFAGLGVFDGKSVNGNIKLRAAVMLALEAGVKWSLSEGAFLYTGAYFDYGFNRVDRPPFRSNVAAEQLPNFALLTFPNRANIMTAGLKLRLAFSH